ncbi:helix-turn-helix domain-containing protein [Streptomyces sioyaensis]|uniref:helix-turn-helix domain-containing protein n=1 Tax=Streptomyces sioyaensis TaxID=67364 RepID=UPI0037A29069
MVKSGHAPGGAPFAEVGYRNPDRPLLGVEVLDYTSLTSRLSAEVLALPHRLDFHVITLVTGGTGTARVDFVHRPCTPGTVLHVSPGQVQQLPRPADGRPGGLQAALVLFTAAFPPRLERTAPLLNHPFGPVAWSVPQGERDGLARAMGELAVEYRRAIAEADADGATVDLLRQLLGALLLRLTRLPAPEGADRPGAGDEVYRRFQRELERSFASSRNAADYAARAGYSLRTLNRACQAATGHTAKECIDDRVALEAKRLLAHTDLAVAPISRRLGFSEPTNFGKFFCRATGHTPGAFRAQERP